MQDDNKLLANKRQNKEPKSDGQFENCTLFWMPITQDTILPIPSSTHGLSYPLHSEEQFPVYISGKELDEFQKNGSFSLTPINLVAGALLGCRYRPYMPTGDVRPFLSKYLERCSIELYDGKIDELVLQTAAILRAKNANDVSKLALCNALYLNVNRNKISNDLLLDVWVCIGKASDKDLGKLFQEFHDYSKNVVLDEINPGSVEWLIYARAVTLVYMQIHNMKSDLDLLGSINLVENKIARQRILASFRSHHFDRNLI
jgi:hypothetical protein